MSTGRMETALRNSLALEIESLKLLQENLDLAVMTEAVRMIISAGFVATSASGNSGIAAMKLAHTLCCVNQPAKFMPPAEAIHGGLGCLRDGDVVVLVSRGGKTSELLPIAEGAREKGAQLMTVTENPESPLAETADLVIPLTIGRESDPTGLMATSSFMVTVAIFDALIAGIIQQTGFTPDDFKVIHPGGAVGARLTGR